MPGPRASRAGCAVALWTALAGGCAGGERARRAEPPPEVLVEVLPRDARVRLDGRALGAGSGTRPAPPAGEHVLAVEAEGYEALERLLPDEELAGARVAAALRPLGLVAPALDYDDAEGLVAASEFLSAAGDARDAADYARRAVVLAPRLPAARRALGDALARLGDRRGAADEYEEYLRLAPGAPDAAALGRWIDAARGEAVR
jgi:tetratricopeptide (TPR) repeat protein